MDAIRKALSDVKFRIPKALLQRTFVDRYSRYIPTTSGIDDQIEQLVVRGRVMVDCDLVGGVQMTIPLAGIEAQVFDNYTNVFRIPKSLTQGRSIVSAMSVQYVSAPQLLSYNGQNMAGVGVLTSPAEATPWNTLMGQVANTFDSIPITSTTNVRLIADNTISVQNGINAGAGAYLLCMVANDANMSNIHPRSYRNFSELVVWAVKAYIYNQLVIDVDAGELQGGFNLGMFKTVLESYSDADEAYQNYLKDVWRKVALMNDDASYQRLIRSRISR
jgi:hypothetical protein